MKDRKNKSPPRCTPGQWRIEHYSDFYKITDEQGVTIADIPVQPLDPPEWAEGNAHIIAAALKLLIALEDAFALLDRISDTLHYEDGLPVTFLEARDIEIIYGDAVTELACFETLIREARGQQ